MYSFDFRYKYLPIVQSLDGMWINNVLIFTSTILCYYYISKYNTPETPSRELEWGDINVIHTTDTHGWLAGHRKSSEPEPNGSGDWGDYASFVQHMRHISDQKGVDLLVIDSGDLHDGSGLSDAFEPGGINGHDTNKIFTMLDIDVLTIGNHGLYNADVTLDIFKNFAPAWQERYLTSNTNITDPSSNTSVPIGERFLKHYTRHGRKVTAFGLLFDFPNPNWRVQLQSIDDMIKEKWFQEAIDEKPDFFLLVAHMAINDLKWQLIIDTLKSKHPNTPVIGLGGHQHIRDCVYNFKDKRDVRMASGQFLETIGWLSANISDNGEMHISRKYLDANPIGYAWHLGINTSELLTTLGREIKMKIGQLWHKFALGSMVGKLDRDLYLNRVPAEHPDSIIRWLKDKVLPDFVKNEDRKDIPKIILLNSGAIRYDLYSGEVNKNDLFTAFPFVNTLPYVGDVPYGVAKKMLKTLNELPGHPFLTNNNQEEIRLTRTSIGYVTNDTCPGFGDDVIHEKIEYYEHSPCFGTDLEVLEDSDFVDVVFLSFLWPSIEKALNIISPEKQYEFEETYTNLTIREVVSEYLKSTL
ncbi:hypothetical protein E3Q06_00599 [Wallemia mellicola]|nr:hypothetical protein E3Q21_00432 [Wallemia mellicola]TIB92476.1 hypothetical protein E3Q20_00249 [Wallemia mellicola]TIC37347.1 hypothetical protein E3Q09_00859 [Wallemia mellicola]TIC43343.1 hypothetical protein E3Q07_00596 [Wallemia mellicola]TIC52363.1 hypothetical protein E3Q06_00599 [Wallemia mellicola]